MKGSECQELRGLCHVPCALTWACNGQLQKQSPPLLALSSLVSPPLLSSGWPSPAAGLPHWPAKHNRLQQPMGAALLNIQEGGCSWCDEGRLAPGTRPPTSGKSLTETVTSPTHSQPCPMSASFQLHGCLPQATACTGVLSVPSPISQAPQSAPAYSVRLNTSLS